MVRPAQRNALVPPAATPNLGGRRRKLGGWPVVVERGCQADLFHIDPFDEEVTVAPATWSWAKDHPTVMQEFVQEKAEAVRTMQVRMLDVSRYAPARVAAPRKPVLQQPSGIKALAADLSKLVADLSVLDAKDDAAVQDAAARYGRARDAMAGLRLAFAEAEGSFETAQALLIAKMTDE
jgi:hypothetical protein